MWRGDKRERERERERERVRSERSWKQEGKVEALLNKVKD